MTHVAADTVTNLIASFNFRRAISLVVILLIVGIAAWTVDYYADYSRISRIEKVTALLERLQSFEDKTLRPELESVRLQIAAELAELTARRPEASVNEDSNAFKQWLGRHWMKFVAGALPWFLFSLLMIPGALKGETASLGGFFAFQILTVFFGFVVAVIPPFGNPLVDYLLIPGGIFVFVAIIPIAITSVSAFKKVRNTSARLAIKNNLQLLSSSAEQYFMEKGVTVVAVDQLVGPEPEKYIKALCSVEGEAYPKIISQGEPIVAILPSGEKVL